MLLKVLRSPYFISIVLISTIFILVGPEFPKYKITPADFITESGSGEYTVCTYDLDNDNTSEFIKFKNSIIDVPAIVVYMNNLKTVDQWNLNGQSSLTKNVYGFGDYDSNGLGEVYYLTLNGNNLVLNYFEPMVSQNLEPDSATICSFPPGIMVSDITANINRIADMDDDGLKEVILTVKVGFKNSLRAVFIFKPGTKEIKSYSSNNNTLFCSELFDLNNDGWPEMFFDSRSPANSAEDLPPDQNDNYVSAFVLDQKKPDKYRSLKTIYSPHGFIKTAPFKSFDDTLLVGLANFASCPDPIIYFWNKSGDLQDSVILHFDEYPDGWTTGIFKHKFGEELLFLSQSGIIYTIDESREIEPMGKPLRGWKFLKTMDINEDGIKEYIGIKDETRLVVYSERFNQKTEIEIPRVMDAGISLVFSKYQYKGAPYLYVQNESLAKIYSFGKNWLNWGRYLIALAALLTLWGFIFLIQYQQRLVLQKEQKAMDEMNRLQFQAIANQINPHFSYNILNTIGYSVLNEDRHKAYRLLVKYSTLTRNLIEGGIRPERTLNQEIGFVENYLELQKNRWEDSFSFFIDINPDVNRDMLIPRMILLTFVENAIKHGLTPKVDDRLLKIRIYNNKSDVEAIIEDNGVGRCGKMIEDVASAGQGLDILDRIIDIHRKLHKKDIRYNIEDIREADGNGTRVVIHL